MYLYLSFITAAGIAVVLVLVSWLTVSRKRHDKIIKARDASLTCEELEDHARKIAVEHTVSRKQRLSNWPIPRMNENYNFILSVYKSLNEDVQKKRSIPPAAEWLLDNFYIIEEQVKGIRNELIKDEYILLPVLKCGHMRGYARIYAIAMELVAHTDGQIDENTLLNYLKAYQTHNVLLDREIWAAPTMIRLALVEYIRNVCERIKETQAQWRKADDLLDSFSNEEDVNIDRLLKTIESSLKLQYDLNPSFIEHLSYRLRRAGRSYSHAFRHIDEHLDRHGTNIDEVTKKEHNAQAVSTVSMGNCIISLKFVSTLDWIDIFEATSIVEQILRQDPDGTYPLMDLPSRNNYRVKIEKLARRIHVSEIHIAREAIELARAADSSNSAANSPEPETSDNVRERHVGYYIVGKGIKQLEDRLDYHPGILRTIGNYSKENPTLLYLGSIFLLTAIFVAIAACYAFRNAARYNTFFSILAGIAVLLPSSEVAAGLVNWVMCSIFKPSSFPRLELKQGIPDSLSTMVVIPALLPDEKRVKELLENLETHYLANKEENLYFALAGDYKDSPWENMPGDDKIINTGIEGVQELNKKYSKGSKNIFFYFHRRRLYNERQKKWMGWERKRGALLEFNDLILGSQKTSYAYKSTEELDFPNIKFVITLDADTILPMDGAKKMIGTMAHPLNKPVIDEARRTVTEGYGLIQPRIGFDVESANKSLFSRIFTGQEGIDPYACAISDVYQDLFGEGIFTGKGIYNLGVFQKILKNAIPENTILSHDLLEGSYIRVGLATDIELIDSYPSRYNSYAARMHRWVRGDWQLLPWLGATIVTRDGAKIKNPLNTISRWKIFDNLRRSLFSPALMILAALSLSILPGNYLFWLCFSIFTIGFPLVTAIIDTLFSGNVGRKKIKRHVPVISGLKAIILQLALQFIFLPYQAYLMTSAIFVTLGRVLFTKKNMLEWVTAADVERGQKNSLNSYWKKMRSAMIEAVLIVALAYVFKPAALVASIVLFIIWVLSPVAAYRVSKTDEAIHKRLSEEDIRELRRISRKTWRYFEEFMNLKNHYLAPDNYQEDPPNGIAYRTSPTNIGLGMLAALSARDLGYIGTSEMIEIISNTMSTIEKMEKWNGHLYNWYDTRTLRPLRPRYISTVDSGNMICYMVTLVQGLQEYLKSPIVDIRFINGINDTASLIGTEASQIYPALSRLEELSNNQSIDLVKWSRVIDEMTASGKAYNLKKSPWKVKTDRMLKLFQHELSVLMPWLEVIKNIPDEVSDKATDSELQADLDSMLKALSNSSIPLEDMPEAYKAVLNDLERVQGLIKEKNIRFENLPAWMSELKTAIEKSISAVDILIDRYRELISRIRHISDHTEFKPLYVEKKQLFSIGYNIEENRLTNSFYDLLASEARQTSYIAIARGEAPPKHWFKMGRALTVVDSYKGLVSWTGTMFEYLMPLLIMKSFKNTLLDETYSFVIRSQKKYGRQRRIPWGASESGFYSLDINLDYQYKAIGVPWLGLKRGLIEDAVAAPYATFLALLVDPVASMENIKALKSEGMDGPYGFYEAIDYTPDRLPFGLKHAIIKSFMAHHEGMSLLSLNSYLNDFIMQKRFHADPVVKAAQLLLQEKVPTNLVFTKETKEKVVPFKAIVYKEKGPLRKFREPDPVLPKAHILSNGNYTVMITDRGTGYSKNKTAAITRWREDSTLDDYGMFHYIRNMETNNVWSSAYSPFGKLPEKYEATFTSDKAKFKRSDGNIETETEIVVASGDNAEIRRISFKNRGEKPCVMEVTSYFEVVIAPQGADVAHPAFSNLFVRTEFLPEHNCLIANRRPRSESEKSLWIASTAVIEGEMSGDIQYETDRMQFIGRGHSVANPTAIERNRPLSNTTGPVLDPIMSLRLRVKVEPGKTARISHITAVSESNDALIELIEKYKSPESIESAFRLALTRSQVETRYLNIKASDIQIYQDLISHILFISPLRRLYQDVISQNRKGQSSLWPYGISGDIPIVLVVLRKSDEVDIIYEVLKAHEYWKLKELKVDLVVLNDEENSYTHPLQSLIADIVSSSHVHDTINRPGGIFILNRNNMPEEDVTLLYSVARIALKGDCGSLADQIKVQQQNQLPELKQFTNEVRVYDKVPDKNLELQYFNGLGGFSQDGNEYVIRLEKGQNTPLPWINVVSNPNFGFVVTESGSGYTWCSNSRENKLTPWSNDPVSDRTGEILYLQDRETGEIATITPLPIREDDTYVIRHGFGYSIFEHCSHGIEQSLVQFVPVDEPVKINIVKVKNISNYNRNITLTYYTRPVLGVNEQFTSLHIQTSRDAAGTLLVKNPYNEEFPGKTAFIDCSINEHSVTGNRKEFFGTGDTQYPQALKRKQLSNTAGTGYDPCAAMQVEINLKEGEEKEVVFVLGMTDNANEISRLTKKYKSLSEAKKSLSNVKAFWQEKLGTIQVETPDTSMNLMLNGWLLYQVISCRMWARSAFYQSGGAYGFRDQLQDCLSVAQLWPEITKKQILLHARHQFIEGDVQHWWHEPSGKGTRTRFSDDLLWLPYITSEYIKITGDYEVLDIEMPFIEDELLKEFEDERYSTPTISNSTASLYEHCVRTIEKSLKFGEHGIPLMGSGDWNDGMSTVGNHGRGESVWLGWFLYSVLDKFAPLCKKLGDSDRAERYVEAAGKIAENIEKNAWDGSWYRRAYFDSGIPLGSVQNSECKIDSISQTWAVISGAGSPDKVKEAMSSLENYLVQRDEGLIKLLTPPFDEGDLEPGYIKGYVPGVRENGGQYTHAAAWVIIAFAKLGDGDKAWELFELINPINHTRTHIEYSKYKAEPYVMAADVYAVPPHIGRGGWTWYTGSASWIYRAGLEYILGFEKQGESLTINPCIPGKWSEYSIKYKYLETDYVIKVKNPDGVSNGVKKVLIDGKASKDNAIPLTNDKIVHKVEVHLGK